MLLSEWLLVEMGSFLLRRSDERSSLLLAMLIVVLLWSKEREASALGIDGLLLFDVKVAVGELFALALRERSSARTPSPSLELNFVIILRDAVEALRIAEGERQWHSADIPSVLELCCAPLACLIFKVRSWTTPV